MVYFKYCDGGSFSGSNASTTPSGVSDTVLHWRGKHVLNGGITDMLQNRGLASAAEVVVSGCSAGGLAAFLHCEHFADRIHAEGNATAKVVCMPDSGLFRDFEGCTVPGVCHAPGYHDRLVWVFDWMNATSGVNDACIAAETPASNCMFAEHTMKYLKTPTFPLQGEVPLFTVTFCANPANDLTCSPSYIIIFKQVSTMSGRFSSISASSRMARCRRLRRKSR